MDFHALPRRDLQALCKRNAVRANMTNAAMADALRALPTVDGIEEYVNQPVALPTPAVKAVAEEEQREKRGSPLQLDRCVTVKSPEPIGREDGEKEEEDLKRNASGEKAPAMDVGRRGPSRRARAAPAVAPTTRRRAAAASKSEARDAAAEAVPAPTTRRRMQSTVPMEAEEKVPKARRTSRQLEEEEEKPQCVISDVETVPALPVSDEGFDDPEEVEEATNPQNEEGSGQEEYTGQSALQEPQVDVQQCAAPLPSQEDSPILGLVEQEGGANPDEGQLDEEMGDHHASEEIEMVPVNELSQATLTAGETTEEGGFTGDAGHANEENEAAALREVLQPVTAEASEVGTEDGFLFEDKEDATVDEVLHDTVTCHETIVLDFSGKIGRAAEEEGVVSTDEMPQSSGAMDEDADEDYFDTDICRADEQKEAVTVDNVPQVTVTGNENVFSSDMSPELNSTGDLGDRITSPLFASMLDNVTKSVSNNAIAGEPTASETEDVSQCMRSNSNEKSIKLVAVKEEDEVKDQKQNKEPLVLTELSVRKLRAKLKETLIAHKDEDADEGYFDTDICRADEQKEVVTIDNVPQVTVTDNENVFSSDIPPEFNSAGDLGDLITSPLFADMLDNVTESVSINVIAGEPTVSEAEDVSQCMRSNSNEKSTELIAVEEENDVKDGKQKKEPPVLTKLSLRKLRAKIKETLIAQKRKERVALARLDKNVC